MIRNYKTKRMLEFLVIIAMIFAIVFSLASCDKGKENGNEEKDQIVKVYCFGDYFDPALIKEFEKETGIHVILDTFDTNEEMYPVMEKESVQYDVICVSDYMICKLRDKGLLDRLDKYDIPNKENLNSEYLKLSEKVDPGNNYALPHTMGTMGIMYNSKHIKEGEITSWNDLWKQKYKGQVVMPDSMRDTIGIALLAKGYSINDVNPEHIKEATDFLVKQKPIVYKYATDAVRDMLIGGFCDIGIVWNGEVLYSQEENPDLKYVIPKDGSEAFFDMWAIPANGENKENGAKWINFMLSHKSAMKNFDYLTYSIPDTEVIKSIKQDSEASKILFDTESLQRCEILKPLTIEQEDQISSYWKKFKTS